MQHDPRQRARRPPRSTLVVTAHAGDFVWRAGGAIALAAARGEKVTVSAPDLRRARRVREGLARGEEARRDQGAAPRRGGASAAAALGAGVRFFDAGDYPLAPRAELTDRLVTVYRAASQPDVVAAPTS
ncbi:PIG-L family deacetylase [Streptomyces sp. KL116D]|uniref:PIG-L family deacetylase n=1 Tax=Streptomyces sp. KL116D TaxID=3045152 RepID=UPI0035563297